MSDDGKTRWEPVWGGVVALGAHTVAAALALAAVLTSYWLGFAVVLAWMLGVLSAPRWLGRFAEEHPRWKPVADAVDKLGFAFALIVAYSMGALGLTMLLGIAQSLVMHAVAPESLLFDTSLVVYMLVAFVPGLLLMLAVPSWLAGLLESWTLRLVAGFVGLLLAGGASVVLIFGPVYLVVRVLGGDEPPAPASSGLSATALYSALYGLTVLLSLSTTLSLSRWKGLRPPSRRTR